MRSLYQKSSLPDNYTGKNFLNGLKRNAHLKTYTYRHLAVESGLISQQLCALSLFCSSFTLVYTERKGEIPYLDSILLFCLAFSYCLHLKVWSFAKCLSNVVVFGLVLAGLSPILKTLTSETSSETIWALSSLFFFCNCIFHRYDEAKPAPLAMNAAIFASVLLASRLGSAMEAFGLTAFGILLFTLLPIVRHHVWRRSWKLHILLIGWCYLVALRSAGRISVFWAFGLLTVCLVVQFVCPFWFIAMQKYKMTINGPWDEAKLK